MGRKIELIKSKKRFWVGDKKSLFKAKILKDLVLYVNVKLELS